MVVPQSSLTCFMDLPESVLFKIFPVKNFKMTTLNGIFLIQNFFKLLKFSQDLVRIM